MSIAPTLEKYLADESIEYDVITHESTRSSSGTAEACHIPGDRLAKGVVLRCGSGYVLAVLPASHHLRLSDLKTQLGRDVDLASETEIDEIFRDCAHGAVPPVGRCYGLNTIVDDSIQEQPEVYLEGGDHATLLHMSQTQFARLTAQTQHGRFTTHS
ncbi:YbaK/EbsC family protein [Inquilinus limosus]|uniref:aminoacyl-tRNA deacylase n=1 Tax=Inquilinus limosus TaxID=171674 RepID=UPI003F163662